MNTSSKWVFTMWRVLKSRAGAVLMVVLLMTMTAYAATENTNTVDIHDEDQTETLVVSTTQTDAAEILQDEGIAVEPGDIVKFTGIQDGQGEITIDRAFTVTVTADGKTQTVTMASGTAGDAMKLAGVRADSDDIISHDADDDVDEGDEIIISRIAYETLEKREAIPFEVVERSTPTLKAGKTEVLRNGVDGAALTTYSIRTVDGVQDEPEQTGELVEVAPVSEMRLVGANVPVSDLDFGYEIENFAPTEYTKVIKGARATAYSGGKGTWGASGNHLFYGHVAVNPNVIPYGSQLYIASADGAFVYGYAIASDTGTALMNGIIDVDLYYETFRESQLNGVRYVDVYVLGPSDDSEGEDADMSEDADAAADTVTDDALVEA